MIRPLAYEGAARVGLNHVARRLLRARPLILCFHGVCDEAPDVADPEGLHVPRRLFQAQLEALLAHYSAISLAQLQGFLLEDRDLPPFPLLVTFDDGYRNVARHALPLLRKLGVPCAWFIVPGAVESGQWLWPCQLEHRWGRREDFGTRLREFQRLPASERESRLAALPGPAVGPETSCDYTLATWEEIAHELRRGGVDMGSHGLDHQPLTTCEPARLHRELALSADLIEGRLGVRPRALAYPSGDHSGPVLQATKEAGYVLGFTTLARHARRGDDPLGLPRILVGTRDRPSVLLARAAGWLDWLRGRGRPGSSGMTT